MKKLFFWLAVSSTAFTACTSTDVVEEAMEKNAIGFENVIGKPSRTVVEGDLNLSNFDTFSVFGYYVNGGAPIEVFTGQDVTKISGTWSYDDTQYWTAGATYYFYAYSCGNTTYNNSTATGVGTPALDMTNNQFTISGFNCTDDHQHDLLVAYRTMEAPTTASDKVSLQFLHGLCKVSAKFINDFEAGIDAYISEVKLTNYFDQADLTAAGNVLTWSNPSRTETTSINMANTDGESVATSTRVPGYTTVSVDPVFIIPAPYVNDNVALQFRLVLKQGDQVVLDRTVTGEWRPTEWNPGFIYNYTIHISGAILNFGQIQFNADINVADMATPEDWSDDNTSQITFSSSDNI